MDELLDRDGRLDAVLASVGARLVHPEPSGWARPPARRRSWAPVLVAAAMVLLVLASLVVAPVRRAVADWLGIGSTKLEQVAPAEADPAGLPTLAEGAVAATPAQAAAVLGRPLPTAFAMLGRPAETALAREGGVLLGWPTGATTLWVRRSPVDGQLFVKKLVGSSDGIRSVAGLGEGALLIDRPHVLETPERRVAAGRVVLWVVAGWEYRLESDLPAGRLVAAARAVAGALER